MKLTLGLFIGVLFGITLKSVGTTPACDTSPIGFGFPASVLCVLIIVAILGYYAGVQDAANKVKEQTE